MNALADIMVLGWPLWQIGAAMGALGLAFWIQGAVGFGSGLFAVPILIWCGIPLPVAIALCGACVLTQCLWNSYLYREHIPWKSLPLITVMRFVGLPVGIAVLTLVASVGQEKVKLVVGAMLLLVLIMQNVFRVQPRDHVKTGWTILAGFTGGLFGGLVGMGGPPLVLWVMAHRWPNPMCRAFLWMQFLLLSLPTLVLLRWEFGSAVTEGILIGLICTPVVIIAGTLGARTGMKLSIERLRLAAYIMLYLLAITSITGAVWVMMSPPPAAVAAPALSQEQITQLVAELESRYADLDVLPQDSEPYREAEARIAEIIAQVGREHDPLAQARDRTVTLPNGTPVRSARFSDLEVTQAGDPRRFTVTNTSHDVIAVSVWKGMHYLVPGGSADVEAGSITLAPGGNNNIRAEPWPTVVREDADGRCTVEDFDITAESLATLMPKLVEYQRTHPLASYEFVAGRKGTEHAVRQAFREADLRLVSLWVPVSDADAASPFAQPYGPGYVDLGPSDP